MAVDCGVFVDWSQMGDVSHDAAPGKTEYKDLKELKQHARSGQWAKNHSQRSAVYQQPLKALPCRTVTPDAAVYRDIVGNSNSKRNPSAYPLPEFVDGTAVPCYCLKTESVGSVHAVISCIAGQFPDISYCPSLPAVTALLLHWSADEAQCFESVSRMLACNEPGRRLLDQTFLAYQSACMTFGDLVHKYCPSAHKLMVATATDVLEVQVSQTFHNQIETFLIVKYAYCLHVLSRQNVQLAVNADNFSSEIVSAKEIRDIWSWIPERYALCQPQLLFTTSTHELLNCFINMVCDVLFRFYSHCEGYEPTLMLIRTTDGEVCGAFLSTDWEERKRGGNKLSFFGTGECFVFKMKPEMERYEWVVIKHPELANASQAADDEPEQTGANDNGGPQALEKPATEPSQLSPFLSARHFNLNSRNTSMFMAGNIDSIIIGGGEGNALYIDSELNHGRTERCLTFDNPPLCAESFQIALLEVWGFKDAMAS
uniref:TBC1 domain family member 24 n=1 Tax=Cyprinus carpio TaxID=7962 RepID=A0A8C2CBF2_CYPCA